MCMKVSWSAYYLLFIGLVLNLMVLDTVIAGEAMDSPSTNDDSSARSEVSQLNIQQFYVPAGPLQSALSMFAEQSGLELFYRSELTEGQRTKGVSGVWSVDQALGKLLEDTTLIYVVTQPGTIQLKKTRPRPLRGNHSSPGQEPQGRNSLDKLDESEVVQAPEIIITEIRQTGYVSLDATTATKTDTPLIETPQSISVITRERLAIQDVSTLSEALRYTPGIQGETFGHDSRVDFLRLRGFNDNGNAIFRDGLQLRNSGFGQFRTEIYGMERVDVLRGPSSFLYGQGNPGGIVNLISKRPTRSLFREVEFEVGNFNHYESKFDFSGPFDKNGKNFISSDRYGPFERYSARFRG